MGILILGPKCGGDIFEANDMEILSVVSRQASIAFQNVQLIGELKAKAYENEQFQKEILRAREEERKRISRELHDQVIQALVGLRYQIANIQSTVGATYLGIENNQKVIDLLEDIAELIQTTRDLCQNLRPPALDLGLIPSIRSSLSRFEMKSGIEVALLIEGERSIKIREDIAICLFRCTSEALSNIRRHAVAEEVTVQLLIQSDWVNLSITDNGCGFHIPERLGSLMENNHFGLVSMRERVELLGGIFIITSSPSQGTQLEVSIPLKNDPLLKENSYDIYHAQSYPSP
jgi:signal transduction histidine kinase